MDFGSVIFYLAIHMSLGFILLIVEKTSGFISAAIAICGEPLSIEESGKERSLRENYLYWTQIHIDYFDDYTLFFNVVFYVAWPLCYGVSICAVGLWILTCILVRVIVGF